MNRRTLVLAGALLAGLSGSLAAQEPAPPKAGRWVVDIVHSQMDFRVRHLLGRVRGSFSNWYVVITTDHRGVRSGRVDVTVQTASLNTGNAVRDADLRGERFFAVDSYPELTFHGTSVARSDTTTEVVGMLTIKGHAHPATFTGQFRGVAKDAEGHERIAFDMTTTIDRRDYGMQWNSMVGANSLIGNEVEITIALEAVRVE
jgi:polyisoprenoid-binding protein YceI